MNYLQLDWTTCQVLFQLLLHVALWIMTLSLPALSSVFMRSLAFAVGSICRFWTKICSSLWFIVSDMMVGHSHHVYTWCRWMQRLQTSVNHSQEWTIRVQSHSSLPDSWLLLLLFFYFPFMSVKKTVCFLCSLKIHLRILRLYCFFF